MLSAAVGFVLVAAAPTVAAANTVHGVVDAAVCEAEPFGPEGVAGAIEEIPGLEDELALVVPPNSTSYFEVLTGGDWRERTLTVDSDRELVRVIPDPNEPGRMWATTDPGTTRPPWDIRGPDGLYVSEDLGDTWVSEVAPAGGIHTEILVHPSGRRVFASDIGFDDFGPDPFSVLDPDGTVHPVDWPEYSIGTTPPGEGVLVGDSAYLAVPGGVVKVDDITVDAPVGELVLDFVDANGRIPLLAGDADVLVAGLPDRIGGVPEIRVSNDGGTTWRTLEPDVGDGLSMVEMVDGQIVFGHAFALGRSVDGGQTWEPWCDLPDGVWAVDASGWSPWDGGPSIAIEDYGLFGFLEG